MEKKKKESLAEGCHGERQGGGQQETLTGRVKTGLTESKTVWIRRFCIPGNLLEMQIPVSHPDLLDLDLLGAVQCCELNSLPVTLMCA